MIRERKKETKTDTVLLILVLLLAVFGLVMLFSISEYNGRVRFGDSAYYFKKQLFATALGLMTMYIVADTDYELGQQKPFACMSLKPGLGDHYYQEHKAEIWRQGYKIGRAHV